MARPAQRFDVHILQALGLLGSVLFLVIVFTPLPRFLARVTSIAPRLEPADAIVVLSAGVEPNGVLSHASLRRAVHRIALHRRGLAPRLVFSDGAEGVPAGANGRALLARDLGVPGDRILEDHAARTTREESVRLSGLLRRVGARRILLVTDPQHMARAAQLFVNAGIEVLPAHVDEPEESIALTRQVVQELLARVYYRLARYL